MSRSAPLTPLGVDHILSTYTTCNQHDIFPPACLSVERTNLRPSWKTPSYMTGAA